MTKLPDKLFGREVKGSLERVLREPDNVVRPINPNITAPNLDGFVYVPSINLYVAKQRTHLNESWSQCHEIKTEK